MYALYLLTHAQPAAKQEAGKQEAGE
eukprot:COSAG02_NODE_44264_length_367_cov_2.794776_1_plen_25_part_10